MVYFPSADDVQSLSRQQDLSMCSTCFVRQTSNVLPSSSSLLDYISEQTGFIMDYPLGQLGSAVLAMSPTKILPTFSQKTPVSTEKVIII